MRDSILLGKPAGVDEPLWCSLCIAQCKTEVDARLGRWLDLGEDMIAIERYDRLARARLCLLANAQTQLQQCVVDWPQMFLLSCEHLLDILLSSLQVSVGAAKLFA